LKKAVKKVIAEKKKSDGRGRRDSAKYFITALDSAPSHKAMQDEDELTQEERERVVEILLGQDKVISLLYDRPPASAAVDGAGVAMEDPNHMQQMT